MFSESLINHIPYDFTFMEWQLGLWANMVWDNFDKDKH